MSLVRETDKIRLGISSCLVGEKVRYDGQHKRDDFVAEVLAQHFDLVPVCPEVEVGMGIPREPVRLVPGPSRVRMVGVKTNEDHTDQMSSWSKRRLGELAKLELGGYVFKKDSPSCGVRRVRIWHEGTATREGTGLFAAAFLERFPLIPVEEEGRLHDPALRESFIERVFALARVRSLGPRPSRGALVAFHTREKMLLLAHGQGAYRALGRLVADAKSQAPGALFRSYEEAFATAIDKPATRKNHRNVFEHMLGFLKDALDAADKAELLEAIAAYARQEVPRIVPMTLLRHHVRKHGVAYLANQSYLEPHPRELMLLNHV